MKMLKCERTEIVVECVRKSLGAVVAEMATKRREMADRYLAARSVKGHES